MLGAVPTLPIVLKLKLLPSASSAAPPAVAAEAAVCPFGGRGGEGPTPASASSPLLPPAGLGDGEGPPLLPLVGKAN